MAWHFSGAVGASLVTSYWLVAATLHFTALIAGVKRESLCMINIPPHLCIHHNHAEGLKVQTPGPIIFFMFCLSYLFYFYPLPHVYSVLPYRAGEVDNHLML